MHFLPKIKCVLHVRNNYGVNGGSNVTIAKWMEWTADYFPWMFVRLCVCAQLICDANGSKTVTAFGFKIDAPIWKWNLPWDRSGVGRSLVVGRQYSYFAYFLHWSHRYVGM